MTHDIPALGAMEIAMRIARVAAIAVIGLTAPALADDASDLAAIVVGHAVAA